MFTTFDKPLLEIFELQFSRQGGIGLIVCCFDKLIGREDDVDLILFRRAVAGHHILIHVGAFCLRSLLDIEKQVSLIGLDGVYAIGLSPIGQKTVGLVVGINQLDGNLATDGRRERQIEFIATAELVAFILVFCAVAEYLCLKVNAC